ncbi:MAG: cation diffusion facilitator family transporter, partial [Bacteroidaceae bacterium]|nr:cation diffusion facilitator family transporter [Bacteroidaceae bacterium]
MDSILTFAKENVDLISLFIGVIGVLLAIVSLYVEIRNKRKKQSKQAAELTPTSRNEQIIQTSYIGIATNVLLAGFKAAVGLVANSVAIVMDAVNNLSDALSSVITIVGAKLSQRPADQEHPFGHGRIEYFSAIIIAILVMWAGVTSLIESVKKIIHPTEPDYSVITLTVIILAIGVKLILGQYVKKKGQELKSDALIASGSDALFD